MNSSASQQGFVLATTVWMIAIMMLLGSLFHGYVRGQLDRARALQDQLQQTIDLQSTEQTLLYLFMTRRLTRAGVTVFAADQVFSVNAIGVPDSTPTGSELRLDASVYRGLGCARFSLQDRAGLVALNGRSMQGWFGDKMSRISSVAQLRSMTAALGDYIDEDNRRRLAGAESSDYRQARMPGPANEPLRSDVELFGVFGWGAWLSAQGNRQWREWLDIGRANILNVNTAPPGLLAFSLGISEEEAERLVRARTRQPFLSLSGVAEELGRLNSWNRDHFKFEPASQVRLELWCDRAKYSKVRGVALTPQDLVEPAQTDYQYRKVHSASGKITREILEVPGNLFTDALPAGPG